MQEIVAGRTIFKVAMALTAKGWPTVTSLDCSEVCEAGEVEGAVRWLVAGGWRVEGMRVKRRTRTGVVETVGWRYVPSSPAAAPAGRRRG